MAQSAVGDFLLIGALAALAYAAYEILQPVEEVAGAVGDAVGTVAAGVGQGVSAAEQGVANAYTWATSSSIVPTGNVIMPNGTVVPLSQLAVTFNSATNQANFSYGGGNYVISQNPTGGPAYDSNGNYHATLAT